MNKIEGTWLSKKVIYGDSNFPCWDTINTCFSDVVVYHKNNTYDAGLIQCNSNFVFFNDFRGIIHSNCRNDTEYWNIRIVNDTMFRLLYRINDDYLEGLVYERLKRQ